MRRDFLEQTLHRLAAALEQAGLAEQTGPLGRLDPRVKLAGFMTLLLIAAASRHLPVTLGLWVLGVALAVLSGPGVRLALTRLWAGVALFTGLVVLPAAFLTPGPALWTPPGLPWAVTAPGLRSAAGLLVRAETTATFASLMALTTPWPSLLRALRFFRVPALAVVVFAMATRFIFVLLNIARDAFEARRARHVGRLSWALRRQVTASGAAMLLGKSLQLSGEVYEAMLARGFRGEAVTLAEFRMNRLDWAAAALFLATVAAAATFEWGCRA